MPCGGSRQNPIDTKYSLVKNFPKDKRFGQTQEGLKSRYMTSPRNVNNMIGATNTKTEILTSPTGKFNGDSDHNPETEVEKGTEKCNFSKKLKNNIVSLTVDCPVMGNPRNSDRSLGHPNSSSQKS
jgi:hypothetical protein